MSFEQKDLDAIQAAIATGARDVQIQGRRILFRSLQDLLIIERKISQALGTTENNRKLLGYSDGISSTEELGQR